VQENTLRFLGLNAKMKSCRYENCELPPLMNPFLSRAQSMFQNHNFHSMMTIQFRLYNASYSLLGTVCFRAQLLQPGGSVWGLTSQQISVPRECCGQMGSS